MHDGVPNRIVCACLVAERDGKILLVRVRNNTHWYLQGGKVEPGERPQQALKRELLEELGVEIEPESIRYLYTVRGPAYGQAGEVELICFSAQWRGIPQALGEISEVDWLDWKNHERLAPAVQILCRDHLAPTSPAIQA